MGCEVLTYTQATQLVLHEGRIVAVRARDALTGEELEIGCRQVVNAAGPWVDAVNALLPDSPPKLIGGTWGTHLILPLREGGPRHALYSPARRDGRPLFMLPWDGRLLLGTTDVAFEGNPDDLHSEPWEAEYLLDEINALFPEADYDSGDVQHQTVGIRPLPFTGGKRRAAAITRRHFLVEHHRKGGPKNLYSVVGGKLSTFHSLADEVVRKVVPDAGPPNGAEGVSPELLIALDADLRRRGSPLGLSEATITRLIRLYGVAAWRIVLEVEGEPNLAKPLVSGCDAILAEVRHAIEIEGARTVDDVLLRRLVLLPPPEGARKKVEALLRGR